MILNILIFLRRIIGSDTNLSWELFVNLITRGTPFFSIYLATEACHLITSLTIPRHGMCYFEEPNEKEKRTMHTHEKVIWAHNILNAIVWSPSISPC